LSGIAFDIADSFLKLFLLDRSDYRCGEGVPGNPEFLLDRKPAPALGLST
jgi:hypothetical protein